MALAGDAELVGLLLPVMEANVKRAREVDRSRSLAITGGGGRYAVLVDCCTVLAELEGSVDIDR